MRLGGMVGWFAGEPSLGFETCRSNNWHGIAAFEIERVRYHGAEVELSDKALSG